jgi:hypothetical protein
MPCLDANPGSRYRRCFDLWDGKTGGINVIDLANINSCSFIATQDLGKKIPTTLLRYWDVLIIRIFEVVIWWFLIFNYCEHAYFIFLTFFLLVLCSNAQNTDIEVQIDSITYKDPSTSERYLRYITTSKQSLISLVLNTNELRSNMYNSSSWIPSYRLFQEKNMIETNILYSILKWCYS